MGKRRLKRERVSTPYDAVLRQLRTMREDEFTLEVLKPLLTELKFARVDYHGGVNEEGKDLIC
ncbi:MAG: hypothetical protein HYX69_06550 [Planctomycetia bacterium]|nr:hypothetical protein [Planctomycetia bacterium]